MVLRELRCMKNRKRLRYRSSPLIALRTCTALEGNCRTSWAAIGLTQSSSSGSLEDRWEEIAGDKVPSRDEFPGHGPRNRRLACASLAL